MTNFEKVKQMTAEEFANWVNIIAKLCFYKGRGYLRRTDCPSGELHGRNTLEIKQWLESEVENDSIRSGI